MQDTPTCHGFVFGKDNMDKKDKMFYLFIAEMGLLVLSGLLDFVFVAELGIQSQVMQEVFDVFKLIIINKMICYFVLSLKD